MFLQCARSSPLSRPGCFGFFWFPGSDWRPFWRQRLCYCGNTSLCVSLPVLSVCEDDELLIVWPIQTSILLHLLHLSAFPSAHDKLDVWGIMLTFDRFYPPQIKSNKKLPGHVSRIFKTFLNWLIYYIWGWSHSAQWMFCCYQCCWALFMGLLGSVDTLGAGRAGAVYRPWACGVPQRSVPDPLVYAAPRWGYIRCSLAVRCGWKHIILGL